ncbi:MAG: RidA family protein [Rhodospirillaceae bacterium]
MQTQTIDPADVVDLNVPNFTHGLSVAGATQWVQLSGQVGVRPDGSLPTDFEGQCRQAFANIGACLTEVGMGPDDVTMLRIFLTHREDLAMLRTERAAFFGDRALPSTLAFVAGLVGPDWRVELEVTAAKG